ncbi:RT_RNaseH_2 domain-containing protein [Nephila pilipes]|uniref:RT_RNaseH_2 domain-containing protein n=1 Tax=Nephila pilipes TaxID=299642 RepID=A0A8X6NDV9_NEPPI|nr:RT_RNaseH_2 domain-containing protein [Nephila pilipes]
MQRRIENQNVADSLLFELFLQQLSSNIKSILASISPLMAQKAEEIADKISTSHPFKFLTKSSYILLPSIKFLEGHSNKKKSLRLTKKSEASLQWSEEDEKAFTDAKKALAEATLLRHPILDAPLSYWREAIISPLM